MFIAAPLVKRGEKEKTKTKRMRKREERKRRKKSGNKIKGGKRERKAAEWGKQEVTRRSVEHWTRALTALGKVN